MVSVCLFAHPTLTIQNFCLGDFFNQLSYKKNKFFLMLYGLELLKNRFFAGLCSRIFPDARVSSTTINKVCIEQRHRVNTLDHCVGWWAINVWYLFFIFPNSTWTRWMRKINAGLIAIIMSIATPRTVHDGWKTALASKKSIKARRSLQSRALAKPKWDWRQFWNWITPRMALCARSHTKCLRFNSHLGRRRN